MTALTPNTPPPATQQRKPMPSLLWPTVEQAQRAWAVSVACRLLAGVDYADWGNTADDILHYVRGDQ